MSEIARKELARTFDEVITTLEDAEREIDTLRQRAEAAEARLAEALGRDAVLRGLIQTHLPWASDEPNQAATLLLALARAAVVMHREVNRYKEDKFSSGPGYSYADAAKAFMDAVDAALADPWLALGLPKESS